MSIEGGFPRKVIEASETLRVYFAQENHDKWCLGWVCSRSYSDENELLLTLLRKMYDKFLIGAPTDHPLAVEIRAALGEGR
jgi:hypothetical protein